MDMIMGKIPFGQKLTVRERGLGGAKAEGSRVAIPQDQQDQLGFRVSGMAELVQDGTGPGAFLVLGAQAIEGPPVDAQEGLHRLNDCNMSHFADCLWRMD